MAQDELLMDTEKLSSMSEAELREAFGDEDALAVASTEDLPSTSDSSSEGESEGETEGQSSDGGVAAEGGEGQGGQAPQDVNSHIRQRDGILRELTERRRQEAHQAEQIAYLTQLVQQRQQEEQAAAQAAFDNEPDPFKRLENIQRAALERTARLEQQLANQYRQSAMTDTAKGISESYKSQEAQFTQAHPDYLQAAEHIVRDETKRLTFQGVPEHQAQEIAKQKILASTWEAAQRGENAPQRLYEYARTIGYQGPAQAAPAAPQGRLQPRPVSLSKVSRSAPSNTHDTGLQEPSDLLQNNPQRLYELSAPGQEKNLERYMRELEVAAGGTW
jgi:hypothetical protein